MFKKIFSRFFFPVPLSLEICLIGVLLLWFTKRQKTGKIFVSVGLLLFLFFGNRAVSNQLLKPLECRYAPYPGQLSNEYPTPEETSSIRFVVVLGGGHITNPELPITSQINDTTLVRLIEGIRLHRKYAGSKLILSGGQIFDPTPHAEMLAKLAKELGVNEGDIILEATSKDTKDEAQQIKPLIGEAPFLLVTSATHIPRSVALFQKLGMKPIPAPTRYRVVMRQELDPDFFFPKAANLYRSEGAVYEYLGLAWAKLRGQID